MNETNKNETKNCQFVRKTLVIINSPPVLNLEKWGQSPRNESSVALGSIVVIAMYRGVVVEWISHRTVDHKVRGSSPPRH